MWFLTTTVVWLTLQSALNAQTDAFFRPSMSRSLRMSVVNANGSPVTTANNPTTRRRVILVSLVISLRPVSNALVV